MNNIPFSLHYEWKVVHDGVGKTPNIRSSSSSWTYNGFLWLLCGASSGVGKASEVWRFDLKTKLWSKIDTSTSEPNPNGRDGQAGAYIGNGKFVIFGGQGFPEPNQKLGKESDQMKTQTYWKREVFNDLWVFDCNTLKWSPIYPDGLSFPMGRRGASAIYVKYLNNMTGESFQLSKRRNSKQVSPPPAAHDDTTADSLSHLSQSVHSHKQLQHSQSNVLSAPHSVSSRSQQPRQGSSNFSSSPTTSKATEQPFLENCLVVYGGAGIELSKYTEQIYNDLWVFFFDRNIWVRYETGGIDPLPCTDHRVHKVGDLMYVLGGIADTTPRISTRGAPGENQISDIQVLNLSTLSWAMLPLFDSPLQERCVKLNLHGFVAFPDKTFNPGASKDNLPVPITGNPLNQLILFGGNPVTDNKAATSSKAQKLRDKTSPEATVLLSLEEGTVSPLLLKGEVFPENRYGHMGFSSTPCNYDFELPEYAQDNGGLPQRRNKNFLPNSLDLRTEEAVAYVYGGSNIEFGGYCDPVLFSLVRVKIIDPNALRSSSAPMPNPTSQPAQKSHAHNTARNVLQIPPLGPGGSGGGSQLSPEPSSPFPLLGGSMYESSSKYEDLKTSNIWVNIQTKINNANGSYKNLTIREPNNWEEFKLNLTPSRSNKSLETLGNSASFGTLGGSNNNPNNSSGALSRSPSRSGQQPEAFPASSSRPLSRSAKAAAMAAELKSLKESKAYPFIKKYNSRAHEHVDNRMSQSQLLLEYKHKVHK